MDKTYMAEEDSASLETDFLSGVIKKLTDGTGIVEFLIDNKEERAIFFKHNVFIKKERISNHDSLLSLLYISMPVSIKIAPCTKHSFNFEAIHVQVYPECSVRSPLIFNEKDSTFHGTVQSLTETNGIITFWYNNTEEKAIIIRDDLTIDGVKVPKSESLLTFLKVGMQVTFTAASYIRFNGCSFKVTKVDVVPVKSNCLSGIIESLTEIGGTISFQKSNKKRSAFFCVENVHIGETKLEPGIFLSSPLRIGMLVSFTVVQCKDTGDSSFEATAVFVPMQQDPDVYQGTIQHLTEKTGEVTFQINEADKCAIFFKKSVHFCDMTLKPGVSLLSVLKVGMEVSLTIEECKDIKKYDFKATLIEVNCTPQCFSENVSATDNNNQVYNGTIQRLKSGGGVIEFIVDRQVQKAIFFTDSVILNKKKLRKNLSLLNVLSCGMNVALSVKNCSELTNCNFVATAVEIEHPGSSNTSVFYGIIIVLETASGVVTFWNNNKQQKAIFYRNSIRINKQKLRSGMELSSVLSIGMYVSIKVQKCEGNGFSFKATCVEVNEDRNYTNINKMSASEHIAGGLGTVVEIVSPTTAQLEFELDGQHLGMFKISDFFVNGKKCDDSKELSVYISKGDVYFFDATKRNKDNADNYAITCVWQGQKPELVTLLEPYKHLVQDYKEIPDSVLGNVIAIISSQVAIVETSICNTILLSIDSLRNKEEIQQVTEEGWIQDYLNIGDVVSLTLCTKSKFSGFPLAKSAQRIKSGSIVNNGLVPQKESVSPYSIVYQPQFLSPSLASNENSNETNCEVKNLPRCEINDPVLHGVIMYLASNSGTVEVEVGKQKQVVAFTKNEVRINKERLSSSLPLSSILHVGMTVSLMVDSCLEGGDLPFKATFVDVNAPSPNFDSTFYYGSVESFRGTSGIILFYLDNKVERATFLRENVFYNSSKSQPVTSFLMMIVEVGMRVSVKVMRCTDVTDYNYKALIVKIEDSHLAAYGFGTSLNPMQSVEIFPGIINSLLEEYGTIKFKMNDKNHKAVFVKKDVHLNQNVIPSTVSLLKVLKLDQPVFFRLEVIENIFQATFVEVSSASLNICQYISSSKEQLADVNENCRTVDNAEIKEWKGQITGYLSTSVGIIECCIDGEIHEGFFNRDMIIYDNCLERNLFKLFKLGEIVLFKGKLKPCMHMTRLEIICVWQPQNSEKSQKENFKAYFSEEINLLLSKSNSDISGSSSNEEETYTSSPLKTASDLEIAELEGKITGYLSSSTGIIECFVNGKAYEAKFTKDIISGNEVNNDLQKLLPLEKVVKCDVKIEPFMGKEKLRILSIWEDQTSQNSRRKLWNFADSLQNGQEHTGTVFEILKDNSFIVAIKNVPVLVNKKYFSKPAKFPSDLKLVQFGDSITVIIEKKNSKNLAYDWVAVDAWRTKDVSYGPVMQKIVKSCSTEDLVPRGELISIGNDHGVLIDGYNQMSFQSADAFLFGVSVEDLDLTEIFKPGDKFSYSLCLDSQNSKVWYGTQEFEDSTHQRHEISSFCSSRLIDGTLFSALMTRLGNEENLCEQDPSDFSTEGLPTTCQEQVLDISENINKNQQQQLLIKKKRKRRKVKKNPAFDLSNLSACSSLMPAFAQQLFDSSESKKGSLDRQLSSKQVDKRLEHLPIVEVENRILKPVLDNEVLDTSQLSTEGITESTGQTEMTRLGNEENLCEQDPSDFSTEGLPTTCQEQVLDISENINKNQQQQLLIEKKRKRRVVKKNLTFDLSKLSVCSSLMPDFAQQLFDSSESKKGSLDRQLSSKQVDKRLEHLPTEEVENRILKPILDNEVLDTSQQLSTEGITEAPEEQSLGLDVNQKFTDNEQVPYITNNLALASHGESLDKRESNHTQQFLAVLLEARNQFTSLREQLTHSACPVLTDGVKHTVLQHLSHTCNDSNNEVCAMIESGIKDCISGHLLTEAIKCLLDETNPSSHNMESDLASNCFGSTTESGQSEVCTTKDISEEISKILDDSRLVKEVVCIDRGTQTMSTGPVFYTCVFPK